MSLRGLILVGLLLLLILLSAVVLLWAFFLGKQQRGAAKQRGFELKLNPVKTPETEVKERE